MFNNFSDNDDDLFEDSPVASANPFINNTASSNTINPATDGIQNLLDNLSSEDLSGLKSFFLRSKVAIKLFESANHFIYSNTSLIRSVFDSLNLITNGVFQYHFYLNSLEETIIRRSVFKEFLETLIAESSQEIFEQLSKNLGLQLDKRFIMTYFESTLSIMNFTLADTKELYLAVCSKVERTPMDFEQVLNSPQIDSVVNGPSYVNNVFASIRSEFNFGYGDK
jgi:hypothetical protein